MTNQLNFYISTIAEIEEGNDCACAQVQERIWSLNLEEIHRLSGKGSVNRARQRIGHCPRLPVLSDSSYQDSVSCLQGLWTIPHIMVTTVCMTQL